MFRLRRSFRRFQGTFGDSSDSLKAGATFTATVKGTFGDIISGSFFSPNGLRTGYNQADGFGIVDRFFRINAEALHIPDLYALALQ